MSLWGKLRSAFGATEAAASVAKPTTPKQHFAATVRAAILEAHPTATVRPHPEAYGLLIERAGKEQSLFLDNAFLETRDLPPEGRAFQIARLVRTMDPPDHGAMSWDEVRPRLVVLLRSPALFAQLPQIAADRRPLARPFVPFLIECVGIDSDDGIAYASREQVTKWGVQPAEAFAAAVENGTAYFTDDVEPYDRDSEYPLWHVARSDSYESSRLLVPGWLASFAGKVKGRPVAVVPSRSLLVVGGDGDDRCLQRLITTAKTEFLSAPRRTSPALYTVDDAGRVIPFALPAGHPLAGEVALGHVLMAMSEYEEQKEPLQKRLGDDAFVPSYKALKRDDGSVASYAVWSRGSVSLLPEVDEVWLVLDPGVEGTEVIQVPWGTLMRAAGKCLERVEGEDPPRWRAQGWPGDEAMRELRAK